MQKGCISKYRFNEMMLLMSLRKNTKKELIFHQKTIILYLMYS
ncbi:hypothetical protein ACE193_00680 [Bernardetia sp. OM2101]